MDQRERTYKGMEETRNAEIHNFFSLSFIRTQQIKRNELGEKCSTHGIRG